MGYSIGNRTDRTMKKILTALATVLFLAPSQAFASMMPLAVDHTPDSHYMFGFSWGSVATVCIAYNKGHMTMEGRNHMLGIIAEEAKASGNYKEIEEALRQLDGFGYGGCYRTWLNAK